MNKRAIPALCATLAMAVLLTGCSFFGSSKNKLEFPGSTLAGQVTAIEENAVTMTLGFITEPSSDTQLPTDDTAQTTQTPQPADESAQPTDESAQPTDEGTTTGEPPAVNDESEQLEQQNSPQETAAVDETNDTTSDEAVETTQEPEPEQDTVKGVSTDAVETFTLGTSTAVLTIGDEEVLFTADGKTNAALSDIKTGDILSVDLDTDGKIVRIVIKDVPIVIMSEDVSYFAANEINSDSQLADGVLESTGTDEAAVLVYDGAELGVDGVTISRVSDDSTGGDAAKLYGVGSAIVASNATAFIRNATVNTEANGAVGLFSYGSAKVYAADSKVTTGMPDSAGIQSSLGRLSAWDLTVETSGVNSPAVGAVNSGVTVIEGGLYTTNASDSPTLYSQGTLAASGATVTANAAAAATLCGRNALYIFDSDLTSAMASDNAYAVTVYDTEADTSADKSGELLLSGGSLSSTGGGIFVTNTDVNIYMSGVDLSKADWAYFLKCTGNDEGMGTEGKNGAKCLFTASAQEFSGDIVWDSLSALTMYFEDESSFTGAIVQYDEAEGAGNCDLYIAEGSKWVVTGDSVLTNLYCEGEIVDADGKTVAIKDADGKTLKKGTSEFTITVSSYDDTADMSGALKGAAWETYQAKRPTGM